VFAYHAVALPTSAANRETFLARTGDLDARHDVNARAATLHNRG
jgi:hypothetical protein